jgi:preprotein translocase subunit SecF
MPNPIRLAALTIGLMAALGGCRFEPTIDASGGAEVTVRMRLLKNQTLDRVAKDLSSADVQVVSKEKDKDDWATVKIKMKDVTKLSTAPFFANTAVTLADGEAAGTKLLKAVVTNKKPTDKLPENTVDFFGKEITVVATLPGEIVTSNATSTSGQTATWTWDLPKFFAAKQHTMEATYKLAK